MTQFTTDRNEIERWSDQHDVVPVAEGNRVELVPEDQMSSTQQRVDWETFHRNIDEGDQVVMYHDGPNEQNRLEVSDQTEAFEGVDLEEEYDREQIEERLLEGDTVTGTLKETTVVKETIVEESTLESDIVDRSFVDRRVTDLELLERDCQSCTIDSDVEGIDYKEWSDVDRFVAEDDDVATGERQSYDEYPYGVSVDLDERWLVTIEELEEYTVETRITDVDVTETDRIDSQNFESHIDIDSVHNQLLRSIDIGHSDRSDDVIETERHNIESEFTEDDTIRTSLTSRQIIEKELSEQWRLSTEVTAGSLLSRETHEETVLESGLAETDGTTARSSTEGDTAAGRRSVLTDDDEGKAVVSSGEKIGLITEVDDNIGYVDPDPGLADRISSRLGWTDKNDKDFHLGSDQVAEITDDEVRLAGSFEKQ